MDEAADILQGLLALRDGSPEGEQKYRSEVLLMLGGEPLPGLEPPRRGAAARRPEGTVDLLGLTGAVMFAVGRRGEGALADVLSKDGNPSAKSLVADGEGFVVLVTTVDPAPALLELAARSGSFSLVGNEVPHIWVMGAPEVVLRHLAVKRREPGIRGWWRRWRGRPSPHPLLVGM